MDFSGLEALIGQVEESGLRPKVLLEDGISAIDPRDFNQVSGPWGFLDWFNKEGKTVIRAGFLMRNENKFAVGPVGKMMKGREDIEGQIVWELHKGLTGGKIVVAHNDPEAEAMAQRLFGMLDPKDWAMLKMGEWLAEYRVRRFQLRQKIKVKTGCLVSQKEPVNIWDEMCREEKTKLRQTLVDRAVLSQPGRNILALGMGNSDKDIREIWIAVARQVNVQQVPKRTGL